MTNDQGTRFIRRFARFSRTPDGVLLLLAKVGGLATSVPGRRGRSSAGSISFHALPFCTFRNEVEIPFLTLHRQPRNNSRQRWSHSQQVVRSKAASLASAEYCSQNRLSLRRNTPCARPGRKFVAKLAQWSLELHDSRGLHSKKRLLIHPSSFIIRHSSLVIRHFR